jgi:hypothetical protein
MFSSATGRSVRLAIVTSDRATKSQAGKSGTRHTRKHHEIMPQLVVSLDVRLIL